MTRVMNSKERVRRAIHFQGPDRVPHYLPDGLENDILWLWPKGCGPKQPWTNCGKVDQQVDEWGAVCQRMAGGSFGFGEVIEPPIKDLSRQGDYQFPDRNAPALFEEWRRQIEANRLSPDPKYVLGVTTYGNFERSHKLLGMEELMLAFHDSPSDLHALLDRLCEKQCACIRYFKELGCDGIMSYDDWGVQDRLLIGPDLIDEFYLPRYIRTWGLAHELGMDTWMHSCGYTIGVLPVFNEAGLDVAQLDQQENMGLENLDRVLGGRMAFWCPVDIQRTMITGSDEDIRAYVRRMIATLGSHKGGLISKTYPSPDDIHHDPRKIAVACAAFREFGVYKDSE
jgi:uroporphyrinogen decarboxylase